MAGVRGRMCVSNSNGVALARRLADNVGFGRRLHQDGVGAINPVFVAWILSKAVALATASSSAAPPGKIFVLDASSSHRRDLYPIPVATNQTLARSRRKIGIDDPGDGARQSGKGRARILQGGGSMVLPTGWCRGTRLRPRL